MNSKQGIFTRWLCHAFLVVFLSLGITASMYGSELVTRVTAAESSIYAAGWTEVFHSLDLSTTVVEINNAAEFTDNLSSLEAMPVVLDCGDYAAGYADGWCAAQGGCDSGEWSIVFQSAYDSCNER